MYSNPRGHRWECEPRSAVGVGDPNLEENPELRCAAQDGGCNVGGQGRTSEYHTIKRNISQPTDYKCAGTPITSWAAGSADFEGRGTTFGDCEMDCDSDARCNFFSWFPCELWETCTPETSDFANHEYKIIYQRGETTSTAKCHVKPNMWGERGFGEVDDWSPMWQESNCRGATSKEVCENGGELIDGADCEWLGELQECRHCECPSDTGRR